MPYDLRRRRKIRRTSSGAERVLEEGCWKDSGVDHVILQLQYELHQSRHPYFDLRSLALSPEALLKLTADDVREIRDSVVRHLVDGLDQ